MQPSPLTHDRVDDFLEESGMLVTCTELPSGTTYHIYRASESFARKIKALVPFLLEVRQSVSIGDSLDDPQLVVTIAPLAGGAAGELRRMLREHLAGPCC